MSSMSLTKSNSKLDVSNEIKQDEEIEALGGISRLIKDYGKGVHIYGILGALGAILNGASMPCFFVFFGDLIDVGSATDLNLKKQAVELMLKFFAVGAGFFIFNSMQYVCFGYYGARISVSARKSYFTLLLRQEIAYYDEKNSGAINTALIADCLNIAAMGTSMGLILQHFVTFVGGFVLAFYYSWQLSLILMAVTPLFVVIGIISASFEKQGVAGGIQGADDENKKVDPLEAAGSFSNEVLISIRSVKAIPVLLESKLKEYGEKLHDVLPFMKKKSFGIGLGWGGMMFAILGVMYSVGYWYGGKLVDDGKIDIGDMFLCTIVLPIGAMSLGQLATANADLVKVRAAANKLFMLKDRKPKVREPEKKKIQTSNEKINGNIVFKDVEFVYPSAPENIVLDKVSFEIESGKTLALVGPSGSGKSTVINLLERYYDPTGGDIFIDDKKIHNYDIENLRKSIGYVSQTPLLFAESIKENIRGGNPNINDDDVIKAAKIADAHDFIMQLADKYDTNVGEMGNRLSGGQKQRIAIARAIVSNPSILLLDEATSALDTKSEREVQKAIDNISANHSQTIIVIAHRLSTIKNADKIIVIVDGEKEEEGNHQELIELDGVYAALVQEQQVTDVESSNNDLVESDEKRQDGDHQQQPEEQEDDEGDKNTETQKLRKGESRIRTIDIGDDETKGDDDEKEEGEKEVVPDLGGTKRLNKEYANQFKCVFYWAVLMAILNGASWPVSFALLFPEIITILTDEVECELNEENVVVCETNFEEAALRLVIWWIAMGLYAFIAALFQSYLFGIYGTKLANVIKYEWFAAIIKQDITYHDQQSSATLNANLSVETEAISDGMGYKFGLFLAGLSQIVIGFGIAFYRSWIVSLVFLGLTPLLAIAGFLQSLIYMGNGDQNADPFLDSGVVSQEILINIRTVLAFPYLIITKTDKFIEKLNDGLPIATKRSAVSGFSMGLNLMIAQGIIYGIGMYAGLRFADKGWVTFDDVIGAFFGVLTGGMGLGQAASVIPAFQKANLAANKFFFVKEREPEMRKPEKSDEIIGDGDDDEKEKINGSIQFKNVSFSYHSAPNVKILDDVSFHVESGKSLAIVGPSGSGKSTIISLIERFYDCTHGDIIIDDKNKIENYNVSYLRSSIGLVSQMPLLFDTTIYENIRGGNDKVTKEDIISAAKQANAHDFIEKFDKKYETNVGELGGKLSGGQRQRIAIARALLSKPSILLLDEATSALDSKSERQVQNAIDSITENGKQTIITIAHRLSTIKNCDNILVLVDGKVREYGNHQSLMSDKDGVYYALVTAQTLVQEKIMIHKQKSLMSIGDDYNDDNDNIVEEITNS